jgi:NAD(P)-dependent dehydrogenase (short-subunit alcohol dehydrogenase family)
MAVPQGLTADGVEIQLGTNHLGHFQLVSKLLPLLEKTAKDSDVRIVNLTSAAHAMAPSNGINLEDPSIPNSGAWTRYGQSKLANLLFTRELARRYPAIKSIAVHPGLVQTALWGETKQNNMLVRYLTTAISFTMSTAVQGAFNSLWAATSKDVVSGSYYTPVGVKSSPRPLGRDDDLSKKLWTWSEEQIKSKGF